MEINMGKFLDFDTPFMQKLTKLCDIFICSLLFILTCIPLFTIGAAWTALYYTTVKVLRRNRGTIFREYMHAFRLNFKQATMMWLGFMVILAVLGFNIMFSMNVLEEQAGILFAGGYFAISFFILGTIIYMFPLLSRFVIGKKQLLKMSYLMTLKHLHYTVLMVLLTVAEFVLAWYLLFRFPVAILLIPAGGTWLLSLLMERILYRYIPEEEFAKNEASSETEAAEIETVVEEPAEDTEKTAWYMEK